jgi:F-type H+-transporting ATPase subunit delta
LSNTIIANRYAAALFEAVEGGEAADKIRTELNTLAEVLSEDQLVSLVANPRVTEADKNSVLDGVAEAVGVSDKTQNLLKLLLANGRVSIMGGVAEAFAKLADQAAGRLVVTVTSATDLSAEAKAGVDSRLTEVLGGKADISHRVDADILGGLVIQVGSTIFDNSIRHHLTQLRQGL